MNSAVARRFVGATVVGDTKIACAIGSAVKSVELVLKIDELNVIDETAAEVLVTAVGVGTTTRALGVNADAYQFSLELEKDDDEWMLIGARWGELGQELH